jgi:hypothetical protein
MRARNHLELSLCQESGASNKHAKQLPQVRSSQAGTHQDNRKKEEYCKGIKSAIFKVRWLKRSLVSSALKSPSKGRLHLTISFQ